MLYDFLIKYNLNGKPSEFHATSTSTGRAIEELVLYVTTELGQTSAEISDTEVICEGPTKGSV